MVGYLFIAVIAIALAGFFVGSAKAGRASGGRLADLHSLPGFHGGFIAAWVGIPSLIIILAWLLFQGTFIDALLMNSLPEEKVSGLKKAELDLLISQIKSAAGGTVFGEPEPFVLAAAEQYNTWYAISRWAMVAVVLAISIAALLYTRSKISRRFRARHRVERVLDGVMIFCSIAAILTTFGIVMSLFVEAMRFFDRVSPLEFFFGLNWEPQIPIRDGQVTAGGAFGAIPVFVGTLQIAFLAMLVATPLGLFSAIYLTEYASNGFRKVIKPVLEVLAGIPTVVYGFFAVLVVAPAMREFGANIGIEIAPNSAIAAGAVMGIMLIPFVSSLSDDAITAVPDAMRDGSYGLGATKGETIVRVLLPAALPGIMGGILLATSRAIGETMIVVMAAGIIATLTLNPLEPVTTVTVQIVTLLIGDSEFDNPKTLAAFALGLVLFVVTLCLNVIAQRIVQKYREAYE
ncbi:MAG: phosphate ABC transporter permease subunit PstC [Pseudomonadota bacterium]